MEFKRLHTYPEYTINELGDVYSTKTQKILSYGVNCWRKYVALYKNGIRYNVYIDNLMREAYCKSPYQIIAVKHINNEQLDSRLCNLEFVEERLKIIPYTYDGYQVSDHGNVYSLKRNKVRKLKPGIVNGGYYQVCLCIKGKRVLKYVHKLVALAFLPDCKNSLIKVTHIDGNRTNNVVDNLEWIRLGDKRNLSTYHSHVENK